MHSITTLLRLPEFGLCEWNQWHQFSRVNNQGMDAWQLSGWVCHDEGFSHAARVAGTLPHGIPHPVTSVRSNPCKVPLLLSDSNQNWNLSSSNFSKTPQYQISWKSVQPFSSCYMCTDGRTDEAIPKPFFRVANAPNKMIGFKTRGPWPIDITIILS
jgi:hypothetical protein